MLKSLTDVFRRRVDHASGWSTIGGVGTMVFGAVTVPVLYFLLERRSFAEWVSAVACLNLWCFPESAKLILVTSGADRGRSGQKRFIYLALAGAALTLVVQSQRLASSGTMDLWRGLLPILLLIPAIPLRFAIAEFKGRLQAAGQWRLHATLISKLNFLSSATLLLGAAIFRDTAAIAVTYVLMLLFQSRVLARVVQAPAGSGNPEEADLESPEAGLLGAMLISLGPLLFSQADKFGLRFILGDADFSEYAFCVALAGQINVVGSLPCIPLARWKRYREPEQPALLATAQWMNLGFVALSVTALLLLYLFLRTEYPALLAGRVSSETLLVAVSIYGVISLNAPGYYLLVGRGEHLLVGWINLLAAVLSLAAIFYFGATCGVTGAVAGNAVYCVTVFWGGVAYARLGMGGKGWAAGGILAVLLLLLAVLRSNFAP